MLRVRDFRSAARIAKLYGLNSLSGRVLLALTVVLLVCERIFLAAGVFGFVRSSTLGWASLGALVMLWGIRGLLRQKVSLDLRRNLTTMIAEAALANAGDDTFLQGPDAHAAVFEGRYAAEQVLIRNIPSFAAD